MNTIADTTLNIQAQAYAVLAMLARQEPAFAPYDKERGEYEYEVTTSAWYNGRERGICLVVRRDIIDKKCLIVTFGECRNSDQIFIDSWEHWGGFLNPPTVADFNDEGYKARTYVPYGRVDRAVEVIVEKLTAYFASLPAETPKCVHPLDRPAVV